MEWGDGLMSFDKAGEIGADRRPVRYGAQPPPVNLGSGLVGGSLAHHPPLGGLMDLAEKRRRLRRFHYVEMELLEIIASWVETMVHIPLRAGLAQHIHYQAQTTDALQRALRNLKAMGRVIRAQAPSDELVRFFERVWRIEEPTLRLVALYRVIKPALIREYGRYVEETDALADMGSVRALDWCAGEHRRQMDWAERMLGHFLATAAERRQAAELEATLAIELDQAGGLVSDGSEALYLPYEGWPEHPEVAAARADLPSLAGQWRSSGYTYKKTFEPRYRNKWDSRFHYATSPSEMPEPAPTRSKEGMMQYLHMLVHGETGTFERNGWIIVDFPELPWEMRLDIAQQAWEEGRHLEIVCQLVEGLGGHLGMWPWAPNFGYVRRELHHPVAHLIIGNIINEGGAATWTNEMLDFTGGWGNSWLRSGLEHLAGDEVLHIHFGKKWSRALSAADPEKYWHGGLRHADAIMDRQAELTTAWGGTPVAQSYRDRVHREFDLVRSGAPDTDDTSTGEAADYS